MSTRALGNTTNQLTLVSSIDTVVAVEVEEAGEAAKVAEVA